MSYAFSKAKGPHTHHKRPSQGHVIWYKIVSMFIDL